MNDPSAQGRKPNTDEASSIAGIDYGRVRIGIAMANRGLGIALPYENYTRRSTSLDAARFQKLAEEEKVVLFVVGLPVHLDGGESQLATESRAFGKWLSEETGVMVTYFDERYTSVEASQLLSERRLTKKKRKQRLDMLAAQIMLTAYLESKNRDDEGDNGRDDEGIAPLDGP